MTKIAMINEMIDAGYINVFLYSHCPKKRLEKGKITMDAIIEKATHYLQYHILKEDIEKMYELYKDNN